MVVASGQQVYEYSKAFGDEFNWRMPTNYPIIQPSSLLFEEAMYAIRAEYIRVVQQQSGYNGNGKSPRPEDPGDGRFVKWLNSNSYGLFEPSPSGGHLAGRLPTFSGVGDHDPYTPATINAAYLTDMKNLFRATVSYISEVSNATPQEIMWHHLQTLKRYSDTYAQSGFFFQEFADWSYSTAVFDGEEPADFTEGYNNSWGSDEYIDVFRKEQVHSGVWLTARHIDELRIQPIPYINGTSGDIILDNDLFGHDKTPSSYSPVKPMYCRTDGTLGVGWAERVNIFGNCLVSGMVISMSGGGSVIQQENYLPYDGFSSHLPFSGSFLPASMSSGWYAVFIGVSGTTSGIGLTSGIFPWGVTVDETVPQTAYWPRMIHPTDREFKTVSNTDDIFVTSPINNNPTDGYGRYGFLVTDKMWAVQQHDTKQFSSNNRSVIESGLTWHTPHPVAQENLAIPVDFYDGSGLGAGPGGSGRVWWGSEYEAIKTQNSPSQYLTANCYSFHQDNGTIIRGHASGSSTSLPGNGFDNGNDGVLISEWTLPLHTPTFNTITSGSATINGSSFGWRPRNMTSITHDGSQFVCGGQVTRMSGVSLEFIDETRYKAYFVNDSTYTVTNVAWSFNQTGSIPDGDSQHTDISENTMVYHYDNINSEYLGTLSVDWSAPAIGGAYSGLYAVVSWDFTAPFAAMSGEETRDWYIPTFASGDVSEGLIAQAVDVSSIRITSFFQESDGTLFAYLQAEVSGTSNNHRWVAHVSTGGGHPYELGVVYDVGLESNALNQATNLNRCRLSNFMIGFEY